ncbi:MAG: hypothetical protein ACRBHB_17440 [Arenicella sp.]
MFKVVSKTIAARVAFVALALMVLGLSTAAQAAIQPKMITPVEGNQYYTRYNFMVEKGRHVTTNYWRGELFPVNTKVTLVTLGKKTIVLEVDGRTIKIVNAKKHTQRGTDKIAAELLSDRKIPLKRLSAQRRDDITSGILRLGMTKEQVLMTRGYPPRHKTPSTKGSRWVYWSSRFVQRSLVFENGKLSRGRGIN